MIYTDTLIVVKDMEISKKFYQDVLGLDVTSDFGANVTITEEVESDKEEITYDFLDVYGNSYTAVLLEDIPMHEYNYDQLNIEESIYTYEDTNGNVTSAVGIDVSKYQGDIDWQQVKDYGIEFAIIRLGFRGYGEEGTQKVRGR